MIRLRSAPSRRTASSRIAATGGTCRPDGPGATQPPW